MTTVLLLRRIMTERSYLIFFFFWTSKLVCISLPESNQSSLFSVILQSLTFKGKMSTSLKFKEKTTELDTRSYKCLLLALVKLIHADPKLMLHVSPPQHPRQNVLLLVYLCVCLFMCCFDWIVGCVR